MKYIEKKQSIVNDKYTNYVYEHFDIQNKKQTVVKIPFNLTGLDSFDWNIGVIYGGSGTGKTTLLKEFGDLSETNFDDEKPLISNFDWLEPKESTFLLSAMGLASVPTWLRPYALLSNGEQYRASLAYKVGKASKNNIILVDEFTSVVDRDVAKTMSNALQKYIRRTNKKIILASCHFDIMEWLLPDWTYSPLKGRLERASCRRQRPKIELQIFRCRYETWNMFKKYHYLTEQLNKSAKCFIVTWNDKPVCFVGIIPFPSGKVKNGFRISRIVVLPDYQGLGIGSKICDFLSSMYKKDGKTIYIKTSNPSLWHFFKKSKNWSFSGETKGELVSNLMKTRDKNIGKKVEYNNRISKTYKYTGVPFTGNIDLIKFKSDVYKDVSINQTKLF